MQAEAASRPYVPSISFRPLTKRLIEYWKWVMARSAVVLVCASALLCGIAVYVATTDKIVVGPFSVPREYEDRGYSSEAISNAVVQFIHGNESTVELKQSSDAAEPAIATAQPDEVVDEDDNLLQNIDGRHVVSSFNQSTIADVKVPLTSFTLESLTEMLRTTLGHQPTRVAGEIVSLNEGDSSKMGALDPQRTRVLIRYKIEYPEPSFSILGYHWWSRRMTTITDSLTADGAEDAIRKLAFVTADGVEQRTLVHEEAKSRALRYVARGNIYVGLNDYERAARMFEQANKLLGKQGSAHARLALGVIAEREGDLGEAKRWYEQAAKKNDKSDDDDVMWAHLYLGNLLLRQHRGAKEATAEYQFVLQHAPSANGSSNNLVAEAATYANLGFLSSSLGQWSEATKYFRKAEALANAIRESARKCAYENAGESVCAASTKDDQRPEVKAESLLNINLTNHLLALSYYGLGRIECRRNTTDDNAVKKLYWQAIHADAKHAPTHYQLGKLYRKEGRYKEAIEQFQAAIAGDRQFAPAYSAWKELADQWPALGVKQAAIKPLKRTLASKYKAWGDDYRQAGNPDEAEERFCTAAGLDPGYKDLCTESANAAHLR